MHTIKQSGVIPYRINGDKLEIMLITSLKKKNWIIPKGIVEDNLSPQKSAEKEAYEEAGIHGTSDKDVVGIYHQVKWGSNCRIEVYAMQVEKVLDKWPEMNQRERKWLPIKKAMVVIDNSDLKQIVKIFQKSFSGKFR